MILSFIVRFYSTNCLVNQNARIFASPRIVSQHAALQLDKSQPNVDDAIIPCPLVYIYTYFTRE